MTKSKVAIILCDYSPSIASKFGNFAQMSSALLKKSGVSMEIATYDAQVSEFPSEDDLNDIKAIWITGSTADSFQNDEWILNLVKFIQDTRESHPSVALVGICFGHQIISRALGAKVARNPSGWEFGSYKVQLSEDPEIRELFGGATSFQNLEIHQDVVSSAPEGLKCIGSTEKTQFQGWYQKGKLLTFQGHPEFNEEVLEDLTDHLKDKIGDKTYRYAKESLKSGHDGLELGKVIVRFIEGA